MLKLQASPGRGGEGVVCMFEAMSSSGKSILRRLVKAYIMDVWEEKYVGYMAILHVLNNPVLTLRLGILGISLGLMGKGTVKLY